MYFFRIHVVSNQGLESPENSTEIPDLCRYCFPLECIALLYDPERSGGCLEQNWTERTPVTAISCQQQFHSLDFSNQQCRRTPQCDTSEAISFMMWPIHSRRFLWEETSRIFRKVQVFSLFVGLRITASSSSSSYETHYGGFALSLSLSLPSATKGCVLPFAIYLNNNNNRNCCWLVPLIHIMHTNT